MRAYIRERKPLLWLGLLILTITSLPYLAGYFRQDVAWRFSGFVLSVEDGNSYVAKMLRGAEGEWLFRTTFTAVEQKGFLAFLPYLLAGKLSSAPGQHEQLVALYHLFRWVAGFLAVLAAYDFAALFLADRR